MIVLAKTNKVFGLIRSGKIMTRCDVGMMVSLNWGNHPQICNLFRVNPYDLSRSVCIPTKTLLKHTKTLLQSCICIYPISSKAFSRLLHSIIMSYYVILSTSVAGCWWHSWCCAGHSAEGAVGIRGDPWGWVTCEITIVLGGNNME